jgi:hypothetical protein
VAEEGSAAEEASEAGPEGVEDSAEEVLIVAGIGAEGGDLRLIELPS